MPTPDTAAQWDDLWRLERAAYEADPTRYFRSAYRWMDTWRSSNLMALLSRYGDAIVVRGKSKPNPTPKPKTGQWTQFVDIPLGQTSWQQIQEAFPDLDSCLDALAELIVDGYRISFAFNPQSNAITCSVTCKAAGNPNEGKTFTSFAASWASALEIALYKHFVISETIWGSMDDGAAPPAFG